jgi:methylenetetrahydrofolate dehydrogenase (NADP+)/methenyltetrahydrofolate cyclohydrolase
LTLMDGRAVAREVRAEVRRQAEAFLAATGERPCLAAILVGDDPASALYVRNKERACAQTGLASRVLRLPADTPWEVLERHLDALNRDPGVHGILVQQPLPPHLDAGRVVARTDPAKDVDGLHALSQGRLLRGEPGFVPCTPLGILELLRRYGVPLAGRRAVVVGRSVLVGKPVALLLLAEHATVTICHSRTPDLGAITRQADVLVVAAGRAGLLGPDMVRPGAAVVDVGINRVGDAVVGDVDPRVAEVAGYLTPVPGGVGPMTIAMLLRNTVQAAMAQRGLAGGGGGA